MPTYLKAVAANHPEAQTWFNAFKRCMEKEDQWDEYHRLSTIIKGEMSFCSPIPRPDMSVV